MLRNASAIKGYAIAANDGQLGTVSDFLFDDVSWLVRWLVVDTGNWLLGRKVLLPPSVLGQLDPNGRKFAVGLTMQQVKDSPAIDTERPASRQIETNIYDYYGWHPYWGAGRFMGGYGYGGGAMPVSPVPDFKLLEEDIAAAQQNNDDPHLRSIEAVAGYHIHASDGEIGHVPRSVREIDWTNNLVNLNVDRQRVKDSPAYDASTTVDQAYGKTFGNHYDDIQLSDQS